MAGTTRSPASARARPELPPLTPLEVAAGVAAGRVDVEPLRSAAPATPLVALERAILPALGRTPCCVSFSGGRDSSLVLAVATALARSEGLPPPVPVTNVVADAPDSREDAWQQLVVSHLALDDWVRLEQGDGLDLVGPVAAGVLRRHGLLFPFNAFFHVPVLAAARGGSLLTGVGGDEALDGLRRYQRVLARRAPPRPADAARIAALALPRAPRRALRRRRSGLCLPWLTAEANRGLAALVAATEDRFFGPPRRVYAEIRAARYLHEFLRAQAALGAEADVLAVSPLLDPAVLAALARHVRRSAPRSRAELLTGLFPGLLPAELAERRTKAGFDGVFWRRHSRAFVAELLEPGRLEGALGRAGLAEVVDAAGLAETWRAPQPHAASYLLLQALRLHG